jgi:enoyl-CoA hydratase/carnithine racemase
MSAGGDVRDDGDPPPVAVEERGSLAVIRFERPARRNSLSVETLSALDRAFSSLSAQDDITSVIFTGTGDAFASGADIRELQALTPDSALAFARRGQRLFQKISDARPFTVAAVNGYCMGGGLDLALACRVRVASPAAVFAHPGARLGVITGWGGTQRLPKLIGAARALEMFTTARRLSAEEALEFGLVARVHSDALACAVELASSRAQGSAGGAT